MNAGWWWRALFKRDASAIPALLSLLLSLLECQDDSSESTSCISSQFVDYQPTRTVLMAGLSILGMPLLMQAASPMASGGGAMATGDARSAAVDVADVALGASPGCSTDHAPQLDTTVNINIGDRRYLLYLPVNYEPNKPAPLVLSYHGGTRTAESQQALDLLTTTYFNQDYIVVYPNGIGVR